MTLHHVLQQFSTSACDWLAPSTAGLLQQGRVSVSDSLKRRELLEDFLFWYFDSFVLPLLRVRFCFCPKSQCYRTNYLVNQATFYVTESSAFRNQVLYFRHDDWADLCAPLIQRLTSLTFEKLPDVSIMDQIKVTFHHLTSNRMMQQKYCVNGNSGFLLLDCYLKIQGSGPLSTSAKEKP